MKICKIITYIRILFIILKLTILRCTKIYKSPYGICPYIYENPPCKKKYPNGGSCRLIYKELELRDSINFWNED